MKILIAGMYNAFVNELIKKFDKENDKLYVLTGEHYHGKKPHRVFEQYTFSYTSNSVLEILDSVQPDTIIFTGAYDSNFQWHNMRSESMQYLSGLINLIISADMNKIKHFIYISSQDVFDISSTDSITSDTPTSARDYKGIAITQGEELCRHFNKTTNLRISILRIDHMYKYPVSAEDATDPCTQLCMEALQTGIVTVNNNISFSMIPLTDVVFGIYAFVHDTSNKEPKECYQLSFEEPITQLQIAQYMQEVDASIQIRDDTANSRQQLILDGSDFAHDYQFKVFKSYQKGITEIYQKMRKNKKVFLKKNAKKENGNNLRTRLKSFFTALLPFIENLIIFIPVFMINNRAVGSQYFDKLDFFLLYVLLFAGVYGTKQAVFSATLSVAGYCFRQLYSRTGIELLVDYNTYLWIAQLFFIAMAVGRLKDSAKSITYEKDEEIEYLSSQLEDLVDINNSNNRIKNIYQDRIIDYDDSLVKIYSITSELDALEAGAVLFYAADIISRILGTDDVAIYQIANSDYCRLFSATSEQAKSLGKSVKYSEMTDMMEAINNHQVYVNKTLNDDYPLMASAIYRSDKPIELIMLWGLPFEKMSLYHCNLLTVLGYMIYNSVERADRYLDALATTRFIPDTKLLTSEAFEELHHTYHDAMEKGFTEYTILTVSAQKEFTFPEWSTILSSKLRFSDYIGINENNEVCILLTNSSPSDAQFIIKRFREMNIICSITD